MYEFLWHVYTSMATPQPNKYANADILLDNKNPCRPVLDSLKENIAAYRRAVEGSHGFPKDVLLPTERMPALELPPGSRRDYWWQYVSEHNVDAQPLGSYRTLCRIWKRFFSKILKFGQCQIVAATS